jgi:hypothetical protein
MTEMLEIRDSVPADFGAIELLCPDAFPDEDLLPLVRDLLPEEWDDAWQSQKLRNVRAAHSGELSVPEQWRQRSLWIS